MLRDRGVVDQLDAFRGQRAADRHEDLRVVGDEVEDTRPGGRELFVGRPAIGRSSDLPCLDLLAQAGDSDLEEFVEVVGDDGQELDPLEEWVSLVTRLVQDARVELEPGQLPVEVGVRRPGACRTALAWRDRRSCGCAWFDRGHRDGVLYVGSGRLATSVSPGRRG